MPKQYLTVKEVAQILGVSPLTVRNWDQKERLIAHRNPLNNYRVYKVEEVEKLLNEIEESKRKTKAAAASDFFSSPPKPEFKKLKIETE